MRSVLLILIMVVVCTSCKNNDPKPTVDNNLNELFALMQGSFDSEKQSIVDTTYCNISLLMYPIWKDKGNFYM